ncbi:hypothetical protein LSH36_1g22004 [Paralvinella palmiformis]|uniref:Uncharacterized protein n=1 Tax=Paralvinella palmiformis TaxID=53620 RepID=A0AAD9KGJ3_9ANNE|nr:hypothetical protein LSH36_1g22004 [Paralvinella palmiformis]
MKPTQLVLCPRLAGAQLDIRRLMLHSWPSANYEHILSENRRLSSEIDSLKQIISQLESAKKNHVCVCHNYTPSPPSSVTSQPANAYVINGNESRGSFGEVANSMTSSSLTSPSNPLDDFA